MYTTKKIGIERKYLRIVMVLALVKATVAAMHKLSQSEVELDVALLALAHLEDLIQGFS
jgi:hypothetical protein